MKQRHLIAAAAALALTGASDFRRAVAQDAPPVVSTPSAGAPFDAPAPGVAPPQAAPEAQEQPGATQWPIELDTAAGHVTVFRPTPDNLQGETLDARAAVSVLKPGEQDPVYGAVWLRNTVSIDQGRRTVVVRAITITQSRFPGATADPAWVAAVGQALGSRAVVLSLDPLNAALAVARQEQQQAADIQTTPPAIVFRDHPAVLVQYDGAPRLVQQGGDTGVLRAVNTPFFVALDSASRTYYLKGASHWFAAPDPTGPFRNVSGAPQSVASLAETSGYQDPQQAVDDASASNLEIVTATEPTELIATDGPPQMSTIPGTGLLFAANTSSDLFLQIDAQRYFVLLSGRWYAAPNRNGPWAFVAPDQLPADFARIPADGPKGSVLASVPNTAVARAAVADAQVPQTAPISRAQYDQPPVTYDGEPQFNDVAECPGVAYAANSPVAVLRYGGGYYSCYNAVWYSCPVAFGRPWSLCTNVPAAIYTLPPSCPVYSVRYCRVYGYSSDVVYYGYTPGYVNCYPYRGTVVYGTGYHYNPWFGRTYYARPLTYGLSPRYDAATANYGFRVTPASRGGRYWVAPPRDPGLGGWYGYGGYRPVYRDAERRPVGGLPSASFEAQRNIDAGRRADESRIGLDRREAFGDRNLYVRRGDVRGGGAPRAGEPGVRAAEAGPSRGEPARADGPRDVPRGGGSGREEIFSDRDGTAYRRAGNGWEVRNNDRWQPSPTAPRGFGGGDARAAEPERGGGPNRGESPRADRPARADAPAQNEPARGDARSRDDSPGRDLPLPTRGGTINRAEAPARAEPPARSEPPVRGETPARAEPAPRAEAPARAERPARAEAPARAEPAPRAEAPARAEPPARAEAPSRAEPPAAREAPAPRAEPTPAREAPAPSAPPARSEAPARSSPARGGAASGSDTPAGAGPGGGGASRGGTRVGG